MPCLIHFIVRLDGFLVGAVKFDEDLFVVSGAPALADVLVGQRREALEVLCDRQGWELLTPSQYEQKYHHAPIL